MANRVAKPLQLNLFTDVDGTPLSRAATASTFADNMALPIHRWFRYSAGFSALWVRETIDAETTKSGHGMRVLDPFAGSGTVLVEADLAGIAATGVESHPFVSRLAKAKISNVVSEEEFRSYSKELLHRALTVSPLIDGYAPLIRKCYPDQVLAQLDQLRQAWMASTDAPAKELGWLALASILRQCSPVGTANWQYVLPKKTKAKATNPFEALQAKNKQISRDLITRPQSAVQPILVQGDAREMLEVPDEWATLVITSPPYPNNFDYADATRLEMTFFGEIAGWGDLQETVRRHLVRSCTQHVSPIVGETNKVVESTTLDPIRGEIEAAVEALQKKRHEHGGKKNYHTMIAAYFVDMARVWHALRRVCAPGARVCFVIGDSAPYGIHIPVEGWMGRLALASGFRSFAFEKTRDRNIKWKNRKHRVPLHEGRLWVEG